MSPRKKLSDDLKKFITEEIAPTEASSQRNQGKQEYQEEEKEATKRVSVDMPLSLYKKLSRYVFEAEKSKAEFIRELIEKALEEDCN
ncbi:MAG: ribbon-helix-helix protein, CopG family [Spirulinaceae cyanobacterium]